MSDPHPHLKAVGAEPSKEGAGAAADAAARQPQPDAPSSRRGSRLIVALLVLACLALVIQTGRVGALSGEVTRLSSELVGTRAALVAYEGRLATVREVVGDLSKRLGLLDELVRRDPLAPPPAETSEPSEPTPPVEP